MNAQESSVMEPSLCPNCRQPVADHPENGCVLAALIQVIREREAMSEEKLRELHASTDTDQLWEDLGPLVDRLEEGEYSAQT